MRRPVHRPTPQLCCVVGGSNGLGCGIPLPMLRVVFGDIQFSKFHTHNGDDTRPRYIISSPNRPDRLCGPLNLHFNW